MGIASWLLPLALALAPTGQATNSRFLARWIGQDGHDYVGPSEKLGRQRHSGYSHRDIGPGSRASRGGVPRDLINKWQPLAVCGRTRRLGARRNFKRVKGSRTGDAYIEPAWDETGRPFHVLVRYDDGSTN